MWASVVVVAQISCQDEMAIERSFSGNIAAVEPVLPTRNLSCIEVWAHWHELVVSACADARVSRIRLLASWRKGWRSRCLMLFGS